jgi:thiamine-phosphate pyrophosphorylase
MKDTFGLYLILTNPVAGYEACARAAVDCNIRYLQLRMKGASTRDTLKTAKALRSITLGSATRFIVNDQIDIAIESDADGIHLGQDDLSINEARIRWNQPDKLFGLSTHTLKQVQAAERVQPDYIGIGPVFPTPTKPDTAPALGIELAGAIAKQTALTSVAIGGVNPDNLKELLQSGTTNFCVVRAVNQSHSPKKAIQHLQQIWQSSVF